MSFAGLIFRNLWRQKVRNTLTLVGISIGIATIIALGSISSGLERGVEASLKAGETDFSIGQANASDLLFSAITETKVNEIKNVEGVERAAGVLIGLSIIKNNPYFLIFGIRSEDMDMGKAQLIAGRLFRAEDEIILGKAAAQRYNTKAEDVITLDGKNFKVVGIFETGNFFQDGGAFLNLEALQRLKRRENQVSLILVKMKKDADIEALTRLIEEKYQGELVTMRSAAEYRKIDRTLDIVKVSGWIISLLAVGVGAIGVMNTMIMAVFERTREIGILRAVGWRRQRVLNLILGEAFLISSLAVIVGTVMGVTAVKLILLMPLQSFEAVKAFVSPAYTPELFLQALLIAFIVGLLGGLYPAYRASKIQPQEALRYE